jgi:hypothetical protein
MELGAIELVEIDVFESKKLVGEFADLGQGVD